MRTSLAHLGLLLAACSGPAAPTSAPTSAAGALPAETDLPPRERARIPIPGGSLDLADGGLTHISPAGRTPLATQVQGPLSMDARAQRFAWSERLPSGARIRLLDITDPTHPWTLTSTGEPDRVALSPDGTRVAYVADVGGLPALFLAPAKDGTPVQITNIGIERIPGGGPPPGFVPPPHQGPPQFATNTAGQPVLRYASPTGPVEVLLP
jgi:hypothetical protein